MHRDGANLVDDAAAGGSAPGAEAALRSCGWTVDEGHRGPSTPRSSRAPWPTASRTSTTRRRSWTSSASAAWRRGNARARRGASLERRPTTSSRTSRSRARRRRRRPVAGQRRQASHSRAVQLALSGVAAAANHWRSRELGRGGFGRVYEGQLARFGRVAIKRLESSGRGEREFLAELEMLAGLQDARLVRLLGYAAEGQEKCLVYQYLAGGTLEARLHGTATPMTWIHRLQCAVGVAGALYLHHCAHRATTRPSSATSRAPTFSSTRRAPPSSRTLAWRGAWRATSSTR